MGRFADALLDLGRTAGFTDHVFAMMSLLGFRFAPRIRDLADKRLYVPGKDQRFPRLAGLIGGTINSNSLPLSGKKCFAWQLRSVREP
jgi:TnpA family transposase